MGILAALGVAVIVSSFLAWFIHRRVVRRLDAYSHVEQSWSLKSLLPKKKPVEEDA